MVSIRNGRVRVMRAESETVMQSWKPTERRRCDNWNRQKRDQREI